MFRTVIISMLMATASIAAAVDNETVTWTGWFSDKDCAAPRVEKGQLGPNGTECVKRCLNRGVEAVFISEQAKKLFTVENHPNVKEDVGYYVELTGTPDSTRGSIAVTSVKRLSEVTAMCALPKRK